jgi:hypothetical protein
MSCPRCGSDWAEIGPDGARCEAGHAMTTAEVNHPRNNGASDAASGIRSVAGAEVLEATRALIRRYVATGDAEADTLALWTQHTHAIDAAEATPYLQITSAEPRSGKTRTEETLSLLVAKAWLTSRTSAAVLVRKLDRDAPTLLLDETDSAFKENGEYGEALRAVLNAGHRRGGVASLCVKSGAGFDLRDFSVFGPKALAGIGATHLPETVRDRSIPIELRRRAPDETVERFRRREAEAAAVPIRESLEAWAASHIDLLRDARPRIPEALDDRAADGWEPLLAIADAVGGKWPQRARRAAVALSTGGDSDDESLGIRLLREVKAIFDDRNVDRLPSADIVTALLADESAPWGDLRGKELDARRLARLLKRYRIKPHVIRFGDETPRGYDAADFADAWNRYLEISATSATSATPDTNDVADVEDVALNRRVREDTCALCGDSVDGYTPEGEPRCFAHFVRPGDGALVAEAVEAVGWRIVARGGGHDDH